MRNENRYLDGDPCNLCDAYRIEQMVSNRFMIQCYQLIILFILSLFLQLACSSVFEETNLGKVCSLFLVFLIFYLLIQQFISCCETRSFKKRISTLYKMMLKTAHIYIDSNTFLKDKKTWAINYQKQLALNLMHLDQLLSECKEYQSKQRSILCESIMLDIIQYILDCIEKFEDESNDIELQLKNI